MSWKIGKLGTYLKLTFELQVEFYFKSSETQQRKESD